MAEAWLNYICGDFFSAQSAVESSKLGLAMNAL
jgi:hypothetical protein